MKIGEAYANVGMTAKSRFVDQGGSLYPRHALCMFAENQSVEQHNKTRLDELNDELV